jgi:hypothetical protein
VEDRTEDETEVAIVPADEAGMTKAAGTEKLLALVARCEVVVMPVTEVTPVLESKLPLDVMPISEPLVTLELGTGLVVEETALIFEKVPDPGHSLELESMLKVGVVMLEAMLKVEDVLILEIVIVALESKLVDVVFGNVVEEEAVVEVELVVKMRPELEDMLADVDVVVVFCKKYQFTKCCIQFCFKKL